MKRLIIVVYYILCGSYLWGQHDNHCQKLVNMVMADSCFQSIEYMEKYKEGILPSEETMALYKFKMFGFMNQPDSSIYYLEKILKDYPSIYGGKGSPAEIFFINTLLDLYYKNADYSKSLELYTSIEKGLKSSSLIENAEWVDMQLEAIRNAKQTLLLYLKHSKPQVINVSNREETLIPLIKQSPLIAIPIRCNGTNLQTWVDTGWGAHLFMTKKTAEKCGLQVVPMEIGKDSIMVNGRRVAGGISVVDSLYIGDLLATDIPAFIANNEYISFLPDSVVSDKKQKAKYDSVFGFSDVILGLPLLKMFGSIGFDWNKGEMKIKLKSKILPLKEKPNMFLAQDALFGHLSINGNSFVGLLDTGASVGGIWISPSFNRLHKKDTILLSSEQTRTNLGIGIYDYAKYKIVQNPNVLLNNEKVALEGDVWLWEKDLDPLYKDGLIGLPFFKKIGRKVIFDFVNMRLTAE